MHGACTLQQVGKMTRIELECTSSQKASEWMSGCGAGPSTHKNVRSNQVAEPSLAAQLIELVGVSCPRDTQWFLKTPGETDFNQALNDEIGPRRAVPAVERGVQQPALQPLVVQWASAPSASSCASQSRLARVLQPAAQTC